MLNRQVATYHHSPSDGIRILEADWDNCIILDACRYDLFRQYNPLDGDLSRATAMGSNTPEFLQYNFSDERAHDTVYITANPHAEELDNRTFHAIDRLYATAWDEKLDVVPPEAVTEAVRNAAHDFPNKRLLIHYMQPHAPFVGEFGRQIKHNWLDTGPDEDVRTVWKNLRYGFTDVSIDSVRRAYIENLEIVLDEVTTLSDDLRGKTVVTADHGELLGDSLRPIPIKGYGHPQNFPVPPLIEIPWLELPFSERREVRAEQPRESNSGITTATIEERLAALGYA